VTGHVRKRGAQWEVILELGEQPARRCLVCVDKRGRGHRYWTLDGAPDACPQCGGEMEDFTARRQDILPTRYRTKKEAQQALHDAIEERMNGSYVPPVDLTVADFLQREWLPTLPAEGLAENTRLAYRLQVDKRIVPLIGSLQLQKLTSRDVARLAAHLATNEGARGRILSPATRHQALVVLHKAMGAAVRDGLIRANPAHGVKRPKVRKAEMHTWSAEQLRAFLDGTKDSRLYPLWRFLSQTGLRRGEALGLMLDALDSDAGKVIVCRQRSTTGYAVLEGSLKTDARRTIPIDAGTVDALRLQLQQQLRDAEQWGEAWQATGHVFTRENGEPWHPDRVTKLFDQAVKAAALPRIRLHDLRHTWATLALRAGVHPKVVQERLGHANIKITLDCYSHVLPDMQESAAELVAALVDAQ
jgi:integrase